MTESEIITVLVRYSTTMLGNILEWDLIEELKMIGFKKVDRFTGAGPSIVRELKGVVCEEKEGTIGIIVAPKFTFTNEAVDLAQESKYNIILTDTTHISKIFLHLALDSLQNRSFEFSFYYDFVTHPLPLISNR
ncbi:16625_t:CDS:2 [Cetraspora pellucida]|uniref:16625_t:CDS:1 n=1 Tax=Cetraspora pellucida TaxID=1433469 RepID=A0A9N9NXS4_9GLOM|nr:16625_t:CDS:2 [Cetraspora pellucida]